VAEVQFVPSEVRTFPLVPAAVNPVPPFPATKVPAKVISPVVPVFGVNPVLPPLKDATAEVTAEVQTKAAPFHFKKVLVTVGAVKKLLAPEPVLYTMRLAAPPTTLFALVAVVALAAVPDIDIFQVPVAPVPLVAAAPTFAAVKTTTPV
tara:strand:+ start:2213 stop:2659 length:447 start_codon:yes stop_codon:yes gene_type:complete